MKLAEEIRVGARTAQALLDLYRIEPEDLERIATGGLQIADDLGTHIDAFYE